MRPPSALELMALADGELDEAREAEVERYLAAHPELAAAVARERGFYAEVGAALDRRAGIDLTDDVMAAIDRQGAALRNAPAPAAHPSARPSATLAARGGTVITIALFAAAAAVMLWWQVSAPARAPVAVASVSPPVVATPAAPGEPGTSVSAVDFGSNHGAIFFVRGENTETTPVVWIGEDPQP